MTPAIVVFGCFVSPGHKFHSLCGLLTRAELIELPLLLDSSPTPRTVICGVDGERRHLHKTDRLTELGWSAVSWWDRQGDSRPGSHTCLAARGQWTAEELIAAGRIQVPWAFRVEVRL